MDKRNCIFSGKPSNFKLTMANSSDDLQNWAKKIPCCKEYVAETDLLKRALNEHEMRLVELFYKQEVAKLRVSNIEAQMDDIRVSLQYPTTQEHETVHIDDIVDIPEVSEEDMKMIEDFFEEDKELAEIWEEIDDIPDGYFGDESASAEDLPEIEDNPEWPGSEQCPKCDTVLRNAPGIGPFCPKQECPVGDGPFIYIDEPNEPIDPKHLEELAMSIEEGAAFMVSTPPTKILTEEPEDVKVEKKIVKKQTLWD